MQLFEYLNTHYQKTKIYYTASFIIASRYNYGQKEIIQGIESSFCKALQQHCWIPVIDGQLLKPSDVYFLSNHEEIFRQYVPHLKVSSTLLLEEEFIFGLLGMNRQLTPFTVLELLMKWACNLERQELWTLIGNIHSTDM
jgi:hypothetical protein